MSFTFIDIYVSLTHLCRVDSSTSTFWTSPFPKEGVSGYFFLLLLVCFIEIHVFNANSEDPIRHRVLWRLLWIYSIFQCPFYGTRRINKAKEILQ